jgi:tetratricopeptide (TPR) repeat protein
MFAAMRYQRAAQFRLACDLLERALSISESAPNGAAYIWGILGVLAPLLLHVGEHEKARVYQDRALSISNAQTDSNLEMEAHSYYNSARVLRAQGDFKGAAGAYRRAYEALEKDSQGASPFALSITRDLAELLYDQGHYEQAETTARAAFLAGYLLLAPTDPLWASILRTAGSIELGRENIDKAGPLIKEALAIAEKTYPADHPELVPYIDEMADLKSRTGDHEGALMLTHRVLAIVTKAYGRESAQFAAVMTNSGARLFYQDNPKGAEAAWRAALAAATKALGPEHPTCTKLQRRLSGLRFLEETEPPAPTEVGRTLSTRVSAIWMRLRSFMSWLTLPLRLF